MNRTLRTTGLLIVVIASPACRSLGRDINNALPAFLRAEPGKEEMAIFAKVRASREWSEEDLARQKELFEDYLDQYPTSVYDEAARYHLGEAHFLDDDYHAAAAAFRDFAAVYPVSALVPKVAELQYTMGLAFIEGRRSTFLGIFSNRGAGVTILTELVETFPRSARAADAQWALARHYMDHEEDWPRARRAFRFLSDRYRTSPWYKAALFDEGYAIYRQVKGAVYDPQLMKDAQAAFERYLREAPEGDLAGQARGIATEMEDLQASHLLEVGNWYVAQGKEYTSRFYFVKARALFPRSPAAAEAERALLELGPLAPAPAPPAPPAEEAAPGAGPGTAAPTRGGAGP
jgi:outer membrane protein assembly factor BamD (BamD/ComL family)